MTGASRRTMSSGFFFQAEDGIRAWSVTGVQTCALPISSRHCSRISAAAGPGAAAPRRAGDHSARLRSEERRVGKECSSRAAGAHAEGTVALGKEGPCAGCSGGDVSYQETAVTPGPRQAAAAGQLITEPAARGVLDDRRFAENYVIWFFFSSRGRHTSLVSDWSSDVCSSDLISALLKDFGSRRPGRGRSTPSGRSFRSP